MANNFLAEKREADQAKLDAIALEQKKRQQFVTSEKYIAGQLNRLMKN